MSTVPFYSNLDLGSVAQLLNARLHNVDNAAQTTLAGTLGTGNEGLIVWNTEELAQYLWDGAQFVRQAVEVAGDVIFRGVVDASTSLDSQAEAVAGYQYIVGTAGTLTMTGVTFNPSTGAEVGDQLLFTSATQAYVVQRNDVQATETTLGNVRLATQAEANTGSNDTAAVTPLKLATKLKVQQYVRGYSATVNIPALNSPVTVTHNLGLVDRDAFVITVMHNNQLVSVSVQSVDANSLQLISLTARAGARVNIHGFVNPA